MHGAAIGEHAAGPDLLQIGDELLQRGQQGAGDGDVFPDVLIPMILITKTIYTQKLI